jgi:hypothetical protein
MLDRSRGSCRRTVVPPRTLNRTSLERDAKRRSCSSASGPGPVEQQAGDAVHEQGERQERRVAAGPEHLQQQLVRQHGKRRQMLAVGAEEHIETPSAALQDERPIVAGEDDVAPHPPDDQTACKDEDQRGELRRATRPAETWRRRLGRHRARS